MRNLLVVLVLVLAACGGTTDPGDADAGSDAGADAGPVCSIAVGTGECAPEAICNGAAHITLACGGADCDCGNGRGYAYGLGQGSTCAQIHAGWLAACR